MTQTFWSISWLTVIALFWGGFLVVFSIMELDSIIMAHWMGRNPFAWTLSDNIRRWTAPHRWLFAAISGVVVVLLWVHFFIQVNPQ